MLSLVEHEKSLMTAGNGLSPAPFCGRPFSYSVPSTGCFSHDGISWISAYLLIIFFSLKAATGRKGYCIISLVS